MTNALGARIAEYLLEIELPARSTEQAFRASHRMLPRVARISILRPALIGARMAERQLMREARILESMQHSGVPRVFECGVLDQRPWIATEIVDGSSIEREAARHPLAIGDAVAVLRDAAAILAHAHARGVVHRNLTPRSILRTRDRSFPVCITEWGDAAIPDASIPVVVDPDARFYRAPELAQGSHGEGTTDPRADVFSLGAIMYEAVTLVLPDPPQKFPGVPLAFHRLLAEMLSHHVDERPSAAEVLEAATRLAEVLTDGGPIEEVEVELVDISRSGPPAINSLGWIPPAPAPAATPIRAATPIASLRRPAAGTMRRRKLP
ncbi:MAG TPA: protein kinase [Kofleriaceae bacterium]